MSLSLPKTLNHTHTPLGARLSLQLVPLMNEFLVVQQSIYITLVLDPRLSEVGFGMTAERRTNHKVGCNFNKGGGEIVEMETHARQPLDSRGSPAGWGWMRPEGEE